MVREEILTAAERRSAALVARDADALRALHHPDLRWTTHRGEVRDRDRLLRRQHRGRPRVAAPSGLTRRRHSWTVGDAAGVRPTLVHDDTNAPASPAHTRAAHAGVRVRENGNMARPRRTGRAGELSRAGAAGAGAAGAGAAGAGAADTRAARPARARAARARAARARAARARAARARGARQAAASRGACGRGARPRTPRRRARRRRPRRGRLRRRGLVARCGQHAAPGQRDRARVAAGARDPSSTATRSRSRATRRCG